jgi:hypothetical protein
MHNAIVFLMCAQNHCRSDSFAAQSAHPHPDLRLTHHAVRHHVIHRPCDFPASFAGGNIELVALPSCELSRSRHDSGMNDARSGVARMPLLHFYFAHTLVGLVLIIQCHVPSFNFCVLSFIFNALHQNRMHRFRSACD